MVDEENKNGCDSAAGAPDGLPAATVPAASSRKHDLKFDWLKGPSVLLMVVGIMGILSDKWEPFECVSAFLDLPPFLYSLIIIALAAVLLLVAITSKGARRSHDIDFLHDNWRSI